jgi:hypothetical protein
MMGSSEEQQANASDWADTNFKLDANEITERDSHLK